MIALPANDKNTTRCPLRIRKEKNDEKRAAIDIEWASTSTYRQTSKTVEFGGTEFDSICSTIEEAQQVILDASKRSWPRT